MKPRDNGITYRDPGPSIKTALFSRLILDHRGSSSPSLPTLTSARQLARQSFVSTIPKMHGKLAALLLPVLAAATPVRRGDAPDPNQITIVDTSYSGNGCPQGSVSTSTSTDKTVSVFAHAWIWP